MIGCMRAALRAGQTPKNTPTATLTPKARATDQPVMAAGIGENRPTSRAAPMPSRIPAIPPLTVRATASSRNWRSTSRVRAPTALRSPISRVRSDTLTSMMFITPTPPTTSEMPAIEARTRVRMPRMRPTTPRMSCWVRTWYSCSGWARVTTSRMIACSSSIWPVLGALTAIPSTRLTPNRRWAAVTGTNSSASRATPKAVPTRLITPTTRKRTPPAGLDVGGGEEGAPAHGAVEHQRDGVGGALDVDGGPAGPDPGDLPRSHGGRDPARVADGVADAPDILQAEPGHGRGRAEGQVPRGHEQDVGAERLDPGGDLVAGPAADRHQQDHAGHADHHPEHGQPGAELVGPQRVPGDADGLEGVHRGTPLGWPGPLRLTA